MTNIRRALTDLAEQIAVPEGPPPSELARRFRRRRRQRRSFAAAGIAVIGVTAGVLVPMFVSSGAGHPATARTSPVPLSAQHPATARTSPVPLSARMMALAAGRRVLAASGGPPVGSMGVVGPHRVWVLDGDGLFVTRNGGRNWKRVVAPSAGDPLADYNAIDFLALRRGWVVASQENSLQVDRTVDGGSTWQVAVLPTSLFPRGWQGADVYFANRSDGWVVVQPYLRPSHRRTSIVFSSTDGGTSWRVADSQAPVISVAFSTATDGWGLSANGAGLYRTTNGGISWAPVTLPNPSPNGGTTPHRWNSLTLPKFFGRDGVLLAVPKTGSAITEITMNGGHSWKAQSTPFVGEPVFRPSEQPGAQPTCTNCVHIGDEPFAARKYSVFPLGERGWPVRRHGDGVGAAVLDTGTGGGAALA